jgi:hypothetical protein
LKQWLRSFVGDTPLEEIAALATYSISAVSNAIGGASVPRLRVVYSIAAGVGAPKGRAHELWWAAALEQFNRDNPATSGHPLVEFGVELRKAMLKSDLGLVDVLGRMRQLCAAEGGHHAVMSRATLGRLLAGRTLPRDEHMALFLRALNLRDGEIERLTSRYETIGMALRMVKSAKRR